ncbi:MAG: isoleucine--tRNA ligase [Mycoplasma sp.]|nr:isoleucine--tRNA ligase [Mycoplasma sp.]
MSKNWKETLNMPVTKIKMKSNLTSIQNDYINKWKEEKLYRRLLERNSENETFILHDGPPYANGNLHVGHAMNKIIKDIIVRYKTMKGFYSPFIAGWDTHGLPIENKMLQELRKNQHEFSIKELRTQAKEYALSQVEIQKSQFSAMGLLSDLDDKYLTLDPLYEAEELRILKKMLLDGLVFKLLKPVYWSPSSESALAEAEVEHKMHRSPSIYVSFDVVKDENKILPENTELVVWTTTPWTIPANAAIAVGTKINYSVVSSGNRNFLIATNLIESFTSEAKLEDYKVVKEIIGKELTGIEYKHMLNGDQLPLVFGHHVLDDSGSGLVHIAPYFGEDDFIIGNKFDLKKIMHIEDDGTINDEVPEFKGLFWLDANKDIGMKIDESGKLLSLKFIKHSYPFDWRTKKPIMFRATPQWFISIDKMKDRIIEKLDNVSSYSPWIIDRMKKMIENREEWCISRQRTWGVPITIFYKDGKPFYNEEILTYVIDKIEKEGSDVWFNSTVDELLPEKYRDQGFEKETDIVDVWFDSGASHSSALKKFNLESPYDVYFEGSDQFRGWFNSSLITSVCYKDVAPYKTLLSHGFVVDKKGEKMSKSKGNVVNPFDIIEKQGLDILRLWVANSEYMNDVSISDEILKQTSDTYRKIRNSMKFMDGNIFEFDNTKEIKLTGIHQYIHQRINEYKNNVIKSYEEYNFVRVIKLTNNITAFLSSFYFDIAKDSLYVDSKYNNNRMMFQKNIHDILNTLLVTLAPILPVTIDDLYLSSNLKDKKKSVHELIFFEKTEIDQNAIEEWKEFFTLKNEVYRNIEEKIKEGVISRTNQSLVTIPNTVSDFIKNIDLVKLLMVAEVKFGDKIEINKFDGIKCQRCWNLFKKSDIKNDICPRCNEVVDSLK